MPEERRTGAALDDPGDRNDAELGRARPDDEIDLLCELARSGTADMIPGRPFAVNWTAEIRGYQASCCGTRTADT